jgi:hypothetical protein
MSMKRAAQNLPLFSPGIVTPFDHPWIFEPKHDGFRGVAYISDGRCQLISRRDNVFRRFASLGQSVPSLLLIIELLYTVQVSFHEQRLRDEAT